MRKVPGLCDRLARLLRGHELNDDQRGRVEALARAVRDNLEQRTLAGEIASSDKPGEALAHLYAEIQIRLVRGAWGGGGLAPGPMGLARAHQELAVSPGPHQLQDDERGCPPGSTLEVVRSPARGTTLLVLTRPGEDDVRAALTDLMVTALDPAAILRLGWTRLTEALDDADRNNLAPSWRASLGATS